MVDVVVHRAFVAPKKQSAVQGDSSKAKFIFKEASFSSNNDSDIKVELKKQIDDYNKNGKNQFSKLAVDEDLFVQQCLQTTCKKCDENDWNYSWETYAQGISPTLQLTCRNCDNKHKIPTSRKWHPPNKFSKQSKLNYNTALLFVSCSTTAY